MHVPTEREREREKCTPFIRPPFFGFSLIPSQSTLVVCYHPVVVVVVVLVAFAVVGVVDEAAVVPFEEGICFVEDARVVVAVVVVETAVVPFEEGIFVVEEETSVAFAAVAFTTNVAVSFAAVLLLFPPTSAVVVVLLFMTV